MAENTTEEASTLPLRQEPSGKDRTTPLYRGSGGPISSQLTGFHADMALRPLLEISPHTTVNPNTTQVNATEVEPSEVHPSVRFKSAVQEISPESTTSRGSFSKHSHHIDHVALGVSEVTPDDIRALSQSLKSCPLQERRLGIFSYEPYSLPVSRVSTLPRLRIILRHELSARGLTIWHRLLRTRISANLAPGR